MIKTALFVEGQTELVFVREYLLKSYEYQNISLECYTLFKDNALNETEYSFPNDNATHFYQIINVGNDNAVMTRLLNREQYLWNAGFHRIIALRDMYSKNYRESIALNNQGKIEQALNQEFIKTAYQTIQNRAKKPEKIYFCFAIMEGESWILAFYHFLEKINPMLNVSYIQEQLKIDLSSIDPEKEFFHPAEILSRIYKLVGENYSKSKGNIEAIMAALEKEDFKNVIVSGKCASFRNFTDKLFDNPIEMSF